MFILLRDTEGGDVCANISLIGRYREVLNTNKDFGYTQVYMYGMSFAVTNRAEEITRLINEKTKCKCR